MSGAQRIERLFANGTGKAIIAGLLTVLIGLVTWVGNTSLSRLAAAEQHAANNGLRLTTIESSRFTVADGNALDQKIDQRLDALALDIVEIKSLLRAIRRDVQ